MTIPTPARAATTIASPARAIGNPAPTAIIENIVRAARLTLLDRWTGSEGKRRESVMAIPSTPARRQKWRPQGLE